MSQPTTVYNGYTEYFLTGKELREYFKGEYYSTKRHHTVVLNLKIEDYLYYIGIDDEKTYRIFANEHFCKICDDSISSSFDFFSHVKPENVKFSKNFVESNAELNCPDCSSKMIIKTGKNGLFLSCSNYSECRHSKSLPIIGNYQKAL